MAEFSELRTLEFWRQHPLPLAYVATGVFLFLLFVIGGFPYDRALSGSLAPMGLDLSYSDQHLRFPIGAVLENVRLRDASGRQNQPLFAGEEVALAPGLGTLLGRPSLNLKADAYEGVITVSLGQSKSLTMVNFTLDRINLAQYPIPIKIRLSIRGLLSAAGALEINDSTRVTQSGNIHLMVRSLSIGMGPGLPHLMLATVRGSARIDHGVIWIQQLTGNGPDLSLDLTGSIRLGPNTAQTVMNLSGHLHPTAAGRAHLGFLLNFLPHPPDFRPYTIRGSMASPVLG
ncbi:MAG TPA: type II secretion system protein GspN [Candidatus Binataceae bacterium]|nr:type II secretion system protein GspN [Candidatus Binataceae bacterium]